MKTFTWLSHERPDILRRSVSSFTKALGEESKDFRYIIAESGKSQIAPDYLPSQDFIYIDDLYREKLIAKIENELKAHGLPIEAARFGLGAHHQEGTEGVHRNAINLLTIGETFLSSDDDVIFDIKSLPSSFLQDEKNENFISFKNWEDLEKFDLMADSISGHDFVSLHEMVLEKATFSSPGLRGHSIYGGPRFIFSFDDKTLIDLAKKPQFVSDVLGSRILWSESIKNQITSYSPVATYMLGMNNKFMLAPCFPFGRNVDGAFVFATKALNPEATTGRLNASILHRPVADRGAYSSLSEFDFRINDFIWLIWSEWTQSNPSLKSSEERWTLGAKKFKEIGLLNLDTFEKYLKELAQNSFKGRVKGLEKKLGRLMTNSLILQSSWPFYVKEEIELCKQKISENELHLPVESYLDGRSNKERLELTQHWINSYADLIGAWPVMRAFMQKENATLKDQEHL